MTKYYCDKCKKEVNSVVLNLRPQTHDCVELCNTCDTECGELIREAAAKAWDDFNESTPVRMEHIGDVVCVKEPGVEGRVVARCCKCQKVIVIGFNSTYKPATNRFYCEACS